MTEAITTISGFSFVFCKEHGYRNVAPCPWPNCPNGIIGNKFRRGTSFKGEKEIIFERVRWTTVDGAERYVWKNNQLPSVFSVPNLCRDELYRNIKEYPKVIYHYTDINSLQSIIEKQELWLTDFAYLNDSKEITHGIECTNDILKKKLSESNDNSFSKLMQILHEQLDGQSLPRICVLCFSVDDDSLGQWRGYGHGGKGVAIGIPTDSNYFSGFDELRLDLVLYDKQIQLDLIDNFIHFFSKAYETDRNYIHTKKEDIFLGLMQSTVYEFIPFFKDSSFADEREARLIHIEHSSIYNEDLLKPAPKRFRVSNDHLIPYCTTKDIARRFDKRLPIGEIIIGPQPDKEFVKRGMREFLDATQYQETIIRISKIPYR